VLTINVRKTPKIDFMNKATFFIVMVLLLCSCIGNTKEICYYEEENISGSGFLFIIGGGSRPDYLMRSFISLTNESAPNILIIPFANQKSGQDQQAQFLRLGAGECEILSCAKEDIDKEENLSKLSNIHAIFFTGGSQRLLAEYLNGTRFLDKIKEFYYERGGVIGGTSAGAAIMSKTMITGKELRGETDNPKFISIEKGSVHTSEGFGFLENIIIDQHFLYRKRLNRLFSALLDNPGKRGIGIDESTAIIVTPDATAEVIGESKVLVFEPGNSLSSDENFPKFKVLVLSSGDVYDLR